MKYSLQTMLLPDTTAISILLAEKELESRDLAELTGIGISIIYGIRRGCYAKPKYIGKIARALDCKVTDIIVSGNGADQEAPEEVKGA